MEYNYSILRIMCSEDARGKSGSLTSDIWKISKRKCFYISKFKLDGGYRAMGKPGNTYLFGGSDPEQADIIEISLHEDLKEEVKEQIISLAKHGKDNIAISEIPMTAHLFQPGSEEFIKSFEK